MQNRFHLRGDTAISVNRSIDARAHAHYALQITLSLGTPFAVRTRTDDWREYRALLIDTSVEHQYNSKDDYQAIILLNPLSSVGYNLRRKYRAEDGLRELPPEPTAMIVDALRRDPSENERVMDGLDSYFAQLLKDEKPAEPELHERIAMVLGLMNDSADRKVSLRELADKAFISESHLTHLFKKTTGVPIRRHLMWLRTRTAVRFLFAGKGNLTMAAHHAGFSDSAHFSRTFKLMFGISPGDFTQGHGLTSSIEYSS